MGTIASLLTGLMRKHTGEQFIIYSNSRVKLELTHIRLLSSLDCVQPLCKRDAILITGPMSKEQKFHRTHLFLKHEPASHHATAYHPVPGRILGFQKASLQQLCAFLAGDHQKTGTVWWYQYGPEGQKRPCYVLVQCENHMVTMPRLNRLAQRPRRSNVSSCIMEPTEKSDLGGEDDSLRMKLKLQDSSEGLSDKDIRGLTKVFHV